jgi:NAD(P)-dependent dehydrogenase (short-subunit alcohol dehydrogenase family)
MVKVDFGGRVALVTGGGRGLGRSHARMLASRGARVVVNDLAPSVGGVSAAESVVSEIVAEGGIAVADHHDVTRNGEAMVGTAIDAFGQLDIVVCNAGIMSSVGFAEASLEDWYNVFDVHFRGTVDVLRSAWPHLIRSGNGRIITTSSSGMLGNAGISSYGSAKSGIFGLTRSLAIEGLPDGILANVILPSASTRMMDFVEDPTIANALTNYFQPEHVSALVVWLAHQETTVTNEAFYVGGGRAGRVVMAAAPSVAVSDSTPEMWAEKGGALLVDAPLTLLTTTAELFANQLAEAVLSLSQENLLGTGGLALSAPQKH